MRYFTSNLFWKIRSLNWRKLLRLVQIDEALQATLVPLFPCIFGHFCLPFSPICYILYYASQRYQRVNGILEKYNANMRDRGYYWFVALYLNACIYTYLSSCFTEPCTDQITIFPPSQGNRSPLQRYLRIRISSVQQQWQQQRSHSGSCCSLW